MGDSLAGDRLVRFLEIVSEDPLDGARDHFSVDSVDHVLQVGIFFSNKRFLNDTEISNPDTLKKFFNLLVIHFSVIKVDN